MPLIGANGAIAGVLGAYLLSFPKAKIDTILPLVIILPHRVASTILSILVVCATDVLWDWQFIAGGVNPASIPTGRMGLV